MAIRPSLLIATLALASACAGQSGSEAPPGPGPGPDLDAGGPPQPIPPGIPAAPHCPCDGLHDQQQIRATVLAVETIEPFTNVWRYQLRAEELLSELPSNGDELRPGDHFGGYFHGQLVCGGEVQASFDAGAQVLAFYRRGLQDGVLCCEYLACSDACPSEGEGDAEQGPPVAHQRCVQDCESETAAACAEHRDEAVMRGELLLIAWADALVVGRSEHGTATSTEAELASLTLDRNACMAAIEDRYEMLHPSEPASMDDNANDDAPASDEPPGTTPPNASAATPDAGMTSAPSDSAQPPPSQPTNPSTGGVGPPPAHPEEVRVRCR
jgi:hypothetical protein